MMDWAPANSPAPRHSATARSRLKLASWAVALGVGVFLGYWLAYSITLTSAFALLGTLLVGAIIVGILFVMGVVAAAVGLQPDRRGRPAARAIVGAGFLLVVGVAVGFVTTPVLGLGYQPSVVLEGPGTMNLSLDGLDGYTSKRDGAAFCTSEPDSEAVAHVQANVVGATGTGMVTASIVMKSLNSPDGGPEFGFGISPAVKGVGAAPNWRGFADVMEPIDGGRGGRVVFSGAGFVEDETESPPAGWPAELSGVLSWSCEALSLPGGSALP